MSQRLRIYILRRDQYRCVYCGAAPARALLELDHVVPRAAGGQTHPANLVTSCRSCNLAKLDHEIEVPVPLLALLAREAATFEWQQLRFVR